MNRLVTKLLGFSLLVSAVIVGYGSNVSRADNNRPVQQTNPIVVDFTRDHCPPCRIMAPWVKQLKQKYKGRIDVVEINLDRPQNQHLGIFFEIASVPTQVYIDSNGKEVNRNQGFATMEQMEHTLTALGFVPSAHQSPTKPTH